MRVAFTEVPTSPAALATVLSNIAAEDGPPPLMTDELLPLMRTRMEAWAEAGDFLESHAYCGALFRLLPGQDEVAAEAALLEAFLDRHGAAMPNERQAAFLSLPMIRAEDEAVLDRLSVRLFRLFGTGSPEETVERFTAWTESNLSAADHRALVHQAGNYLYQRGRYESAVTFLSQAEVLTDKELLLRAQTLLKMEDAAGAIADLEKLAKEYPDSSVRNRALFTLGWALQTSNAKEAARVVFQQVIDEFPNDDFARQARNIMMQQ